MRVAVRAVGRERPDAVAQARARVARVAFAATHASPDELEGSTACGGLGAASAATPASGASRAIHQTLPSRPPPHVLVLAAHRRRRSLAAPPPRGVRRAASRAAATPVLDPPACPSAGASTSAPPRAAYVSNAGVVVSLQAPVHDRARLAPAGRARGRARRRRRRDRSTSRKTVLLSCASSSETTFPFPSSPPRGAAPSQPLGVARAPPRAQRERVSSLRLRGSPSRAGRAAKSGTSARFASRHRRPRSRGSGREACAATTVSRSARHGAPGRAPKPSRARPSRLTQPTALVDLGARADDAASTRPRNAVLDSPGAGSTEGARRGTARRPRLSATATRGELRRRAARRRLRTRRASEPRTTSTTTRRNRQT